MNNAIVRVTEADPPATFVAVKAFATAARESVSAVDFASATLSNRMRAWWSPCRCGSARQHPFWASSRKIAKTEHGLVFGTMLATDGDVCRVEENTMGDFHLVSCPHHGVDGTVVVEIHMVNRHIGRSDPIVDDAVGSGRHHLLARFSEKRSHRAVGQIHIDISASQTTRASGGIHTTERLLLLRFVSVKVLKSTSRETEFAMADAFGILARLEAVKRCQLSVTSPRGAASSGSAVNTDSVTRSAQDKPARQ
jgi:hypothetical protein